MKCAACGTELKEGTKFCTECGARLAIQDPPVSAVEALPGMQMPETAADGIPYAKPDPDGVWVKPENGAKPAQAANAQQGPEKVGSAVWIVFSVIMMLWGLDGIFGFALGIAALVFALKIRSCAKRGDAEGARKARKTCIILLIADLVCMLAWSAAGCAALMMKYVF